MNFKLNTASFFYPFRKRTKANLICFSLLAGIGIIALVPGISHLAQSLAADGLSVQTFGWVIADIAISSLMMLPSIGLFCIAYLLLESHSMGYKLAIATSIISIIIATFNYVNIGLALAIAVASGIAAFLEIQERKSKPSVRDSPLTTENAAKFGMILCIIVCIGIIVCLIGYTGVRGAKYINWDFVTNLQWSFPQAGAAMISSSGGLGGFGIGGYIIGSLMVVSFCEIVAIPLGLGAAIYLSEYATQNKITETIRFFIETLAGVPSVVIGILALGLLGSAGLNLSSFLGASIGLAIMILPFNIRVAEEAIRAVPASYREASFALGAAKWETVKKIVLYAATPGIITGLLLGAGAALGEAAVVYMALGGGMPSGPNVLPPLDTLFSGRSGFPVLPIFIYKAPIDLQMGQGGGAGAQSGGDFLFEDYSVSFAAAFVLIGIYLSICVIALLVRNRYSKKITGK